MLLTVQPKIHVCTRYIESEEKKYKKEKRKKEIDTHCQDTLQDQKLSSQVKNHPSQFIATVSMWFCVGFCLKKVIMNVLSLSKVIRNLNDSL